MKHVLLIGNPEGYFQFIDYLLNQNYKITWVRETKTKSRKTDKNIKEINLDILSDFDDSLNVLKEINKKEPFDAVMSHHEFYQNARCRISESFNLTHQETNRIVTATNKYFMKKCFINNDVTTAKVEFFDFTSDIKKEIERIEDSISYPMVVKPINGLGSLGVVKVSNRDELKKAIRVGRQITFNIRSSSKTKESNRYLIVEEYIDGDEFTVDGFVVNGKWVPMISCEKYPPLTGPVFQENVYFFSPEKDKAIPNDLLATANKVVRALNVGDGPYHIEIRREKTSKQCYVVEAAPRIAGMGSTFYNLMLNSTGFNIYELYARQLLGESVENPRFEYKYCTFEFDSYAKKGGVISEIKGLDKICKHQDLMHSETFKDIGDSIAPPGLNPETTAVFYFRTNSKQESMELVTWIEKEFDICIGG